MERHITLTSRGQSSSNFISHFADNIDFEGYEVALKSIYHAPVYNITPQNNSFQVEGIVENISKVLRIPAGYYENNCEILRAINDSLTVELEERRRPVINYKDSGEAVNLLFGKNSTVKFNAGPNSPLLRCLGYIIPKQISKLNINVYQLNNTLTPAFIYSNSVSNSIIDRQQSRLLAVIPLSSKAGYNFHEIENPNYISLASHSICDARFTVIDLDGNEIPFAVLPTVLNLHFRKKV